MRQETEAGDRGRGFSKELADLMQREDTQIHSIAVIENLDIVVRKDNSKGVVGINH